MRRTLAGRLGCGICGSEQLEQIHKNCQFFTPHLHFPISQRKLSSITQAQALGAGVKLMLWIFDPDGDFAPFEKILDVMLHWINTCASYTQQNLQVSINNEPCKL